MLETNKTLAYALNFLGFLIAGLGTSFLVPIYFSIAGRLANGKNSLAVAQLSFVNTLLIFNSKVYFGLDCANHLNYRCLNCSRCFDDVAISLWKSWI
jgi:hypothetical protein